MPSPSSLLGALSAHYSGPYICYDLSRIREFAAGIGQEAAASGARIYGVVKALAHPGLLRAAHPFVAGFDASNFAELDLLAEWAGREGVALPFEEISLTGPAMGIGSAGRRVLCRTLVVNVESASQLGCLEVAGCLAQRVKLGIRVALGGRGGETGGRTRQSRFGLSLDNMDQIQELASHPSFHGFHIHMEGDRAQPVSHALLARHLAELAQALPRAPELINLGGGFRTQTLEQIGAVFRDCRKEVPTSIQLRFEPGTWLSESGGFAVAKVLDIRVDREVDTTTAVIDLSREAHVRWSHPSLTAWGGPTLTTRLLQLVGPTCSEADDFGTFTVGAMPLESPGPSATPLVLLTGVSGYACAFNTAFNGVSPAKVVVLGE